MAVIPVNLARVSQNMRANNLLEALRRNQVGMLRAQNEIATGLRVNQPSDDPLAAAAVGVMDRRLDELKQLQSNLQYANSALTEGESAMNDAVDLVSQANQLALQAADDGTTPDERKALAVQITSILDRLTAVGNRQFMNSYLFGGQNNQDSPFETLTDGVLYRGDKGQLSTIVDTNLQSTAFTISGDDFFSAASSGVHGVVDLNPTITAQTRISDLRGTTGDGVTLGRILVDSGTQQIEIDLSQAATVGDVIDRLNASLPPTLHAAIAGQGIGITADLGGPTQITITDLSGGQAARDLGLSAQSLGLPVGGADLDPRLTLQTSLSELSGGGGLSLTAGIQIQNGERDADIDFSGAQTVEDVLNRINQSDAGVWARISADGRSIDVLNRISGTDLTIADRGGQAARSLGICSFRADVELASLNDGRGIHPVAGNDLRVVTASGASFEVDLDGAKTLQDVIDRLNQAGGGAFGATLRANGNGLIIQDNTAGPGQLTVQSVNLSPVVTELGLDQTTAGRWLSGRDVNPIRADNAFTALQELRDGLNQDDAGSISWAGQRLERALQGLQQAQGRMAAQAKSMDERTTLLENETTATQVLRSNVRDADMTDAIVRFQQLQTALQANLQASSRVMNLSLLDYLR